MNLFKNEIIAAPTSHSHEPFTNTGGIIYLLQDQIELLQEQQKSKNETTNSLIANRSRNDDVLFSQKATTLKTPENQINCKQLQNTKTIESKESESKNTPGCFCNKEKESQKGEQEEDISKKASKNMAIVRSLHNSCNQQSQQMITKMTNQKKKRTKNLNLS